MRTNVDKEMSETSYTGAEERTGNDRQSRRLGKRHCNLRNTHRAQTGDMAYFAIEGDTRNYVPNNRTWYS